MNKEGTLYKVVLLGGLCAICGLGLSGVNSMTAPVIAKARLEKELANLELIYPGAEFAEITGYTDETGMVQGAYEAPGHGKVYKVKATGYSSNGFTFLVAFSDAGKIDGFQCLEQSETSGFGARCFEPDFMESLKGVDATEETPLLSGATVTSTAIRKGVAAAASVFTGAPVGSSEPASEPAKETAKETAAPAASKGLALSDDFKDQKATCEEVSNDGTTAVYSCSAAGFQGTNEATVTVDLATNSIQSIEVTKFDDTPSIGDAATAEDVLAAYVGLTSADEADITSGATFTTKSVAAMASAALKATGSESAAPASYADGEYEGEGNGNNGPIKVKVTVADGKIAAVEVIEQDETPAMYSMVEGPVTEGIVANNGTAGVDTISGATNSSKGILEAVDNALAAAGN